MYLYSFKGNLLGHKAPSQLLGSLGVRELSIERLSWFLWCTFQSSNKDQKSFTPSFLTLPLLLFFWGSVFREISSYFYCMLLVLTCNWGPGGLVISSPLAREVLNRESPPAIFTRFPKKLLVKDPDWLFSLLGVGDGKHDRTKTEARDGDAKSCVTPSFAVFLDKIPFLCELVTESCFQRELRGWTVLTQHGASSCRLQLAPESEKGVGHWEGHRRPWWGRSTDFLRASSSQGTFLPHLSKDSDSLGNNRKRKKDSRGSCRLAQEEHSRKPSVHFLHLFSSSPHMASLTSSHHQPSSAKRGEGPAPPVL